MSIEHNAGCFSTFYQSGLTALTSTSNWLHYTFAGQSAQAWHVSSASILTDQIARGHSAAQAFQGLANSGYRLDSGYGATIAARITTVDAIEDCLRSKGIIQ